MSDFNSSLPVRTETNGDVAAKIVDGTVTSQALAVDAAGLIGSKLYDSAGTGLTSTTIGSNHALDVWDAANGPVTPGTVAAYSTLIGGQYNTALPTLTNGQQSAIQVDSSGRLLTTNSNFPVTVDTNYGVVGANTLRTAAQIGNATGAADFNAGTTGAQTLRVAANQGAPNTIANAWPTKLTDGTNTASITAAGELTVDITQPLPAGTNVIGSVNQGTSPWVVSGTVAATQSGAWTVAATQSGTWTVGLSEDMNYGVVGANTLRTAAQIGNVTGAADFNYGAVGAQTLRVAAELGNATGALDYNAGATSAQTLRTVSNQGAPNTVANAWPMLITDGTNTATVSSGGDLNVTVATALPAGSNNIGSVNQGTSPWVVSGTVAATQSGAWTVAATQDGTWTVGLSEDHNYGVVGAGTLRTAAQIGNATGAADFNAGTTGAQTLRVVANLNDATGTPFSATNPLPVTVDTVSGTAIDNYKDAAAVAANASDNHDYTVTALKTFYFDQVIASASGKAKMLVAVETGIATGIFTTKFVQFNSTADTNMDVTLASPISVATGVRIRVTLTNLDKAAQDLYSTICGNEI